VGQEPKRASWHWKIGIFVVLLTIAVWLGWRDDTQLAGLWVEAPGGDSAMRLAVTGQGGYVLTRLASNGQANQVVSVGVWEHAGENAYRFSANDEEGGFTHICRVQTKTLTLTNPAGAIQTFQRE
jgi:hypothetical protein